VAPPVQHLLYYWDNPGPHPDIIFSEVVPAPKTGCVRGYETEESMQV